MVFNASDQDAHARLVDCLRGKFSGPGWVFMKTVANRLGGPTNYADAMALSLYQSTGRELHGFEAKVSRGDVLRELKSLGKSDSLGRYCDRWWLVVESADLVLADDLIPPTWGVLARHSHGTKVVRKAEKIEPEPWGRDFVAGLLIRAKESMAEDTALGKEYDRGYEAGEKRVRESIESRERHLQTRESEHLLAVAEFEKASGLSWYQWSAGDLGKAVDVVLHRTPEERVRKARDDLVEVLGGLDTLLARFKTGANGK